MIPPCGGVVPRVLIVLSVGFIISHSKPYHHKVATPIEIGRCVLSRSSEEQVRDNSIDSPIPIVSTTFPISIKDYLIKEEDKGEQTNGITLELIRH